jgi:hypothetical protein
LFNFVTAVDDTSAESETSRSRAKVPPVTDSRDGRPGDERDLGGGEQIVTGVHRDLHPVSAARAAGLTKHRRNSVNVTARDDESFNGNRWQLPGISIDRVAVRETDPVPLAPAGVIRGL